MSKFLDHLTGYLFSGHDATAGPSSGGGTAVAGRPGDSADLPADAFKAYADGPAREEPPMDSHLERHEDRPGWSGRLRERLGLRRPLTRGVPGLPDADGRRPWGDEETASPRIHPLAVIDPRAELAADVEVGPFCVIGPRVTLGPGCKLHNNVTIAGHTTIGSDNEFFPNCTIGADPQDKKFSGADTRLIIGDSNVFRESVTVHLGTEHGGGITRIGDGNLLMVNAHVGHDATIGNNCVLANNVMIAGHCSVGNRVSMMGGAALHHFVSIGDFVFVGGYCRIHHDVPPYVKVDGADDIRGINVVGLRRGGISDVDIAALEIAGRRLFYAKRVPMSVVIAELVADENLNPRVRHLVDFLRRRNLGKHGRYLESLRH